MANSPFTVTISLATVSAQAKGFGIALILGSSNRFTGGALYATYSSAAGMLVAGGGVFMNNDPEYLAAVAYFSQYPSPQTVMVGYAPADVAQVSTLTPTVQNSTPYSVTINGVASTITSGSSATASAIVTALAAAINAQSPALPVVTSGSTTLILTSSTAGLAFTISASSNLAIVTSPGDVGPDTALTNIVAAGGTAWYALISVSRTVQDILDCASWIETNGSTGLYIYIACSADSAVGTSVTTDVASQLQAKSYTRTLYFWSSYQAQYPDAALAGVMLPYTPGSATAAWKTLIGITPDTAATLTATVLSNFASKNVNYYTTVYGVAVTQPGIEAGGKWLDQIIGLDWISSTAQQALFNVLINNPKVPYTDPGITQLCNALRGTLKQAVTNGILAKGTSSAGVPYPNGYIVTQPLASSFTGTQKNSRLLPSVPFSGLLAGAINGGTFTGTLIN